MAAQKARRQAAVRVQFRRPIDRQPAMRRLLADLQAVAVALRIVLYRSATTIDAAEHAPDAAARDAAAAEAALLTPVVKAFGTDWGFRGASAALQVWGGYGYVREAGIEQTLRDARIAMIYEGTNEIQALDLVQRKLLGAHAAAWDRLLDGLQADAIDGDAAVDTALRAEVDAARAATAALREHAATASPGESVLRVADDFLAGTGHLLLAWAWARQAHAATAALVRGHGDPDWMRERLRLARHGVAWVLPQAAVHWQRVRTAPSLDG
jgi:hypothetical protein